MNIILVIILVYLTISVLYLVVFSVASKFSRKDTNEMVSAKENKIAVFIAAYKEDAIIVDTAKKALNQEYAADKYEVVIIADSLQAKTLTEL